MKNCMVALLVVLLAGVAQAATVEELMERGHWKRARSLADEHLKAKPNDAHALYLMARVKLTFGDPEGALALAERAAKLEPRNADYRFAVAAAYGNLAQRAGKLRQFGLARRFKREAEAALQLDPSHLAARHALITFHLNAPGIVGGSKAEVRRLVEEIRRIAPAEGYLAEIRLALEDKQTQQVEPLLLKALQADSRNYSVHLQLAAHYASEAVKKYDLAEKHAREAMRLEPQRSAGYSLLAQSYAVLDRVADMEAVLQQWRQAVPDDLNPHYQAGRVLLGAGRDLERAEAFFRQYLKHEPEPGSPSHAAAHWRLGQVLEKLGRKPEAVAQFQAAVRLNPRFEPARNDLRRLR